MQQQNKPLRLFRYCTFHPVFSHILLILALTIGTVGIFNIQTQLIPNLAIPQIFINFIWPGADAQQVEQNITQVTEDAIQNLSGLEDIISVTSASNANIILKFEQSKDMSDARQKATQALERTTYPQSMEDYQLNVVEPRELLARISFQASEEKLGSLSREIKRSLDRYQIKSVEVFGKPEFELQLTVNPDWLQTHPITTDQLVSATRAMVIKRPSGFIGEQGQYSSSEIGLSVEDVIQLNWALQLPPDDALIPAKEIFSAAELVNSDNTVQYFEDNSPLAEVRVFRGEEEDLLTVASRTQQWFSDNAELYQSSQITMYSETWQYYYDRMNLIIKNGSVGLILILALLSAFLSKRDAIWVAAGLPISILSTIALMYLLGFHISMISMFAVILSLGIIVDDAIVVAEQASTLRKRFDSKLASAIAATQMLKPVMTSSMTTLAAFFPLLFISGVAGQFLQEIPIVVITVIVASLFECFLILPKHLSTVSSETKVRRFTIRFRHFRTHLFLPFIRSAIRNRWLVITSAICFVFLTTSLLSTGRIRFSFFPDFSSDQIIVQVAFDPAATFEAKKSYLSTVEQAIAETALTFDDKIIDHYHSVMNQRLSDQVSANPITDGIHLWLTDQDKRDTSNAAFTSAVRANMPTSPIVENINIDRPRGGPPSDQVQIELTGDITNLTAAAEELKQILSTYGGLSDIDDDASQLLPKHRFSLSEMAVYAGINTLTLQDQLSAYLNTSRNIELNVDGEEIDLVMLLPQANRDYQAQLNEVPIKTDNGALLPLGSITNKTTSYSPQLLIRKNQTRTYTVTAQVDSSTTNTYAVESDLTTRVLPELVSRYNISTQIGDIRQEQNKTVNELKAGALIGFAVIYLVLTWSLASFVQPLAVLFTLPLTLTGGVLGHWILGFDITLLSLFGFFGLAGVTVNDSIILTLKYQELKRSYNQTSALIGAACTRFRAVILTSLTTIGGLLPLMFETSYQAQFIIPMAITIAFGLLFGTFWILVLLPAILSLRSNKDI